MNVVQIIRHATRIFNAKTYIETKLRMPISQTGLVFPTENLAYVCVLKLSSSGQIIFAKQKCHISLQEYLKWPC